MLQDSVTLLWEPVTSINIRKKGEKLIKIFPRPTVSTIKIFPRGSQERVDDLTGRKAKETQFLSPQRLFIITAVEKKAYSWLVSFPTVISPSLFDNLFDSVKI